MTTRYLRHRAESMTAPSSHRVTKHGKRHNNPTSPSYGHLYVLDTVGHGRSAHPAAVLDEFNAAGAYRGQIAGLHRRRTLGDRDRSLERRRLPHLGQLRRLGGLPLRVAKALGNKCSLTSLEMTLRTYSYKGRRRSFVSAGCPAPDGFPGALFTLARTTFSFAGGTKLSSTLTGQCKVRAGVSP
jgi:hypothetical protein